ncbi:RNase H family protein [Oryzomonas rubra]|uniref:Ribonuclease H n=1 Tax=Oryzomonas rubra TaxID=2509454 RepID=A0A5A9XQ69_9BACT|nr:RNase H family protein [Oryzomonas rubra]KAA0895134.1 ribonuclease H [Oryzomonas rubra]
MNSCALFTDVSLNPQRKLGVGGYLLVPASFLENEPYGIGQDDVSARLKIKGFAETSSTTLEVQTVLWALEQVSEGLIDPTGGELEIYTDSQCVAGLLGRRAALEQNDFIAKRSGRLLSNAALYRAFYAAHDRMGFRVNKVSGHAPACSHNTIHRIFSHVDQGVRRALGLWLDSPALPGPSAPRHGEYEEAHHGNDR